MEKKIQDQLEESGASKHLRSSAFECSLFGTGILKGPMALDKEYPSWNDTGKYEPVVKTVPTLSHVSIWNFYPDPDAANMDQAEYVVERHKMSRRDLKDLKKRPYFRKDAIDDFNAVVQSDQKNGEGYYNRALHIINFKLKQDYCSDLKKANQLGFIPAKKILNQYCKL